MANGQFDMEGVNYYEATRKCGKAACKCASGQEHGPYWFQRRHGTNKVVYIGKKLPPAIEKAYMHRQMWAYQITDARARLHRQLLSVERLLRGEALTEENRSLVSALGLADFLVSAGSSTAAKEIDPADTGERAQELIKAWLE